MKIAGPWADAVATSQHLNADITLCLLWVGQLGIDGSRSSRRTGSRTIAVGTPETRVAEMTDAWDAEGRADIFTSPLRRAGVFIECMS